MAQHERNLLLDIERRIRLVSDQPITLVQKEKGTRKNIQGKVIDIHDYALTAFIHEEINTERLHIGHIAFDPTFILTALETSLIQEGWLQKPFAQALIKHEFPETNKKRSILNIPSSFNENQQQAISRGVNNAIHIIWGPPGTGKTHTMAQIIVQHIKKYRSCLLLSASNVAVDQLLKAVIEQIEHDDDDDDEIIRYGIPQDRSLDIYTPRNRFFAKNPDLLKRFDELNNKRTQLQRMILYEALHSKNRGFTEKIAQTHKAIQNIQTELERIEQEQVSHEVSSIIEDSICIATTLASLFVTPMLHQLLFDAVFIDEISMVPLLYILAGAGMSSEYLTLAGDPKQLPPIYQSEYHLTRKWIGTNLYEYLNIEKPKEHPDVTFLNEQYRMQSQISELVSELSYHGQLHRHHSLQQDANIYVVSVEKMNSDEYTQGSYYSVAEKSYYFPLSAFLISNFVIVKSHLQAIPTLLLSPFRAQEKLLSKLCQDLPIKEVSSSTIHRSQGSEKETVFLDLTIHDPQTAHQFFQNVETAKKLLNVAISRAKFNLVILCNFDMLSALGRRDEYYLDFSKQLNPYKEKSTEVYPSIIEKMDFVTDWLPEIEHIYNVDTCFYASLPSDSIEYLKDVAETLTSKTDKSPVIIIRDRHSQQEIMPGVICRTENLRNIPPMAICGSKIFFRVNNLWAKIHLPHTANTLKNIAAKHLLDREIDIEVDGKNFILCQYCGAGNMELTNIQGMLRMCCTNPHCRNQRWIRRTDLQILAKVCNIRCPNCNTEMAPRKNKATGEYFFGCMNYPNCQGTRSLYEFASKVVDR